MRQISRRMEMIHKTIGKRRNKQSNPLPLADLYFNSFSYPAASIVSSNIAILSLSLLLLF